MAWVVLGRVNHPKTLGQCAGDSGTVFSGTDFWIK